MVIPGVVSSCYNLSAVFSRILAVGLIWYPVGIGEGYFDSSQWFPNVSITAFTGVSRLSTNPESVSFMKISRLDTITVAY